MTKNVKTENFLFFRKSKNSQKFHFSHILFLQNLRKITSLFTKIAEFTLFINKRVELFARLNFVTGRRPLE